MYNSRVSGPHLLALDETHSYPVGLEEKTYLNYVKVHVGGRELYITALEYYFDFRRDLIST